MPSVHVCVCVWGESVFVYAPPTPTPFHTAPWCRLWILWIFMCFQAWLRRKPRKCQHVKEFAHYPRPSWSQGWGWGLCDVYGKSFSFSGLSNFIRKNLKQPLALIYCRYISAGGNDYDRAERKWETSMRKANNSISAGKLWAALDWVHCEMHARKANSYRIPSSSSTKSIFPMEPESNDISSTPFFSSAFPS